MRIKLIAVGSRMPRWVEEGWQEYVKRLPAELPLDLVEIPLNTRGKNADVNRLIRQEGEAMLAGRGRLVIRPSGTEPLIRVMAEGDDAGQVERVVDMICDAVRVATQ